MAKTKQEILSTRTICHAPPRSAMEQISIRQQYRDRATSVPPTSSRSAHVRLATTHLFQICPCTTSNHPPLPDLLMYDQQPPTSSRSAYVRPATTHLFQICLCKTSNHPPLPDLLMYDQQPPTSSRSAHVQSATTHLFQICLCTTSNHPPLPDLHMYDQHLVDLHHMNSRPHHAKQYKSGGYSLQPFHG